MNAIIKKWGNSLGVRISKPMLQELNLHENSEVELTVKDNTITITPKSSLEDLLLQITKENLHSEINFGKPEGKEIW